ncbi:hypothetical protein BD410DRAFT_846818 [Rickenella mellea]|uniref:DUF4219 domain-containing protein n=1 Tax=Rickenella mellea TaxID=50990 RepID=A0A4Y7PE38_9AGAM|nr:hypothetical protein BD410DRAFT_846818 [Rickenella mellea]
MSSSAGGSSIYRIDPLKGAENYPTWKIKIKDILTDMGLEDHIVEKLSKPSSTQPSGSGTTPTETGKDKEGSGGAAGAQAAGPNWAKNDRTALSAIRLRVADIVLVYIANATTALEAWKTLRNIFEERGPGGKVQIRKKLIYPRAEEGADF